MMRIILNFLFKLRSGFQKAGNRLFSRLRKDDGKLKYLSPEGWRRLLYVFAATFFAIVLISQLFTRDRFLNKSFDDYQKEVQSDGGTRMRNFGGRTLFDKDPLSGQKGGSSDPVSDIMTDPSATAGTSGDMFGRTPPVVVAPVAAVLPAASDCFAVIEKAKTSAALSVSDRARLKSCIQNNVVPLAEGERNLLRALASDDLSQPERDAIIRTMAGPATSADQNLSDVITASTDPEKQTVLSEGINSELKGRGIEVANDDVRGLSKTVAEKPKNYSDAIQGTNKILAGSSPSEAEKTNLIDAIRAEKGGEMAALDNPALSTDKEQAIQGLLSDISERNQKVEELQKSLQDAQIAAQGAVAKLGKGQDISDTEQAEIDKLGQLRRQLSQAKAAQEKRQKTLVELVSRLQKTVAQASMAIQQSVPSGVFEAYADYEQLDCKNLKPLPIKFVKHKKTEKEAKLSKNGMNLRPKQAFNIYKVEDQAKKNGVEYEGKRLDISKYMASNINVAELFIMKGSEGKGITISPETKIAAMLDTEIMVSASGAAQSVRIKIIQDVYDAKTRQIIIPKGSIAMGKTSGFDEQTGVMEFSVDRVSVGSGNIVPVTFRIGSGDGRMGLHGQIRDTRGRYLLGAFVTSFAAGALDFFTQNTLTAYQQSKQAVTALTGSAMSGGAEVMQKIATQFASDMQSASPIFYSPRGLPLVLFPE
jgi:hypothetical protein